MSSEAPFSPPLDAPPTADSGPQPAEPPAVALSSATAWRNFPAHLIFWIVAVAGVAVDLWSKEWAFQTFKQAGGRSVIPHVLEIYTMLNPGALFGIGHGQTLLFVAASVVALFLVLWMFAHSLARRRILHIALGAVLAGAMGNMYDRVFVRLIPQEVPGKSGGKRYFEKFTDENGMTLLREYPFQEQGGRVLVLPRETQANSLEEIGCVRDFIKINTRVNGKELWPWVFNVADMLLVFGVSVLAIQLWRERRPAAPVPVSALDSPSPTA